MRIAAEVQTEMAIVLGRIFGLCLRAQDDFVDELLSVSSLYARQDPIESFGLEYAAFGEGDVERRKEFTQRLHLFDRRLIVHPVNKRNARTLQRLGRRDVGQNHELFDQPVRFEPLGRYDAVDAAIALEQNLALGQVEVEGLSLGSSARHGFISGIKRFEDRLDQRFRVLIGPPADRGLSLLIGQLGGRPHQDAVEGVRAFASVGADYDAYCEGGTVLARSKRAQIIRDPFRQHRHHPIRKINRIAARKRLAVERRAWRDVVGDVRDGDMDNVAAMIVRCRIGLGVHRVVVILGVGRVYRDERQLPPILAALKRCGPGGVGFLVCFAPEYGRDAMRVNSYQAYRPLALERSQAFYNPTAGYAKPRTA